MRSCSPARRDLWWKLWREKKKSCVARSKLASMVTTMPRVLPSMALHSTPLLLLLGFVFLGEWAASAAAATVGHTPSRRTCGAPTVHVSCVEAAMTRESVPKRFRDGSNWWWATHWMQRYCKLLFVNGPFRVERAPRGTGLGVFAARPLRKGCTLLFGHLHLHQCHRKQETV